jgi:DNA-binding Lrp family transcriptional regulator
MAQMVGLIAERGPRIDEIARAIGVHNETVRHWYKQLLSKGFAIQASCNFEHLGMRRVVAIVELGEIFSDCADTVFFSMGQLAYIGGYAKTKPDGFYIVSASVPQDCLNQWTDFMLDLKRIGVFKSIESVKLDWVRNTPMRAEYFNFNDGNWEFDWNAKRVDTGSAEIGSGTKQKYDGIDLKIMEQLQINANMPLTEICKKVGAKNYKTFAWHYKAHVINRKMIKSYRVNWTGMKYGVGPDESVRKKRKYAWLDVIADGLSESEKLSLMASLNQTPFVWMEGSGARSYFARMVLPAKEMSELLKLLETASSPIKGKVKWYRMDIAHALSFSIPTHYYDEDSGRWSFNRREVFESFVALNKVRHEVTFGNLKMADMVTTPRSNS